MTPGLINKFHPLLLVCAALWLAWPSAAADDSIFESVSRGEMDLAFQLPKRPELITATNKLGATLLHAAAPNGRLALAALLLEKGALVDATNLIGETPLMLAAKLARTDVMRLLLNNKASIHATNIHGASVLHYAADWPKELRSSLELALGGHADIARDPVKRRLAIEMLVAAGARVDHSNPSGSPLHFAAVNQNKAATETLLELGANPNLPNRYSQSPLHLAAVQGSLEVVEALVRKGAHINAAGANGMTPLIYASFKGQPDIAEFLIENGARIDISDHLGATALHYAAKAGEDTVVTRLLEAGHSVDQRDSAGNTALMHAATSSNSWHTIIALVEAKSDVSATNKIGDSVLHAAAANNFIGIPALLLERGAPVDVQNQDGVTALQVAIHHGKDSTTELFLKAGANPNLADFKGTTPLHRALLKKSLPIVKQLLAHGAKLRDKNNAGTSPWDLAVQIGSDEILDLVASAAVAQGIDVDEARRERGQRVDRTRELEETPLLLTTHGYEAVKGSLRVSRNGKHTVFTARLPDRRYVLIRDGITQEPVDDIGLPAMSLDGESVACAMKIKGRWSMLVNGKIQCSHDEFSLPIFSASGRLLYAIRQGDQQSIVLDGKPQKFYDQVGAYSWSLESDSYFYIAREKGKELVVFNGEEQPRFDEIIGGAASFLDLGNAPIYAARAVKRSFLVARGKREKAYDRIQPNSLRVNKTGKFWAYAVEARKKEFVVVNQTEQEKFDQIFPDTLQVAENAFAYRARRGSDHYVMFNQTKHRVSSEPVISLSENGQSCGWIVTRPSDGEMEVWVNGEWKGRYRKIIDKIVFSPDGKRFAYTTQLNQQFQVVLGDAMVGGSSMPPYGMTFSPDGQHLAFVAMNFGQAFMVLDGKQNEPYQGIVLLGMTVDFSGDSSTVTYLGVRQESFYLVEERLKK